MNLNKLMKYLLFSCFIISFQSVCLAQTDNKDEPNNSLPIKELQMFAQVFGKIKTDYVEAVDDRKMLLDAINGILAGLDPHSSFLEPEAFREMQIDTEGQFGGVGIEVTLKNNHLLVIAPIADTPADRAGIKAGDIIIKIDGEPTINDSLGDAVNKMRGEIGSKIILTILRDAKDEPLDIEIVRDIIQLSSVRVKDIGEPGLAYMRISSFQMSTADSLQKSIAQYKTENNGIQGLILDLRNNPGGVLDGAVNVSDLFLSNGIIVQTHGRLETAETTYEADSPDLIESAPMVVLVDGGSASASEIVAGALQDHQRAIIMGTQTFGKGSVQTISPINNGSALKITTARYYTPSGRSIQETGITPDILSEFTESKATPIRPHTREADLARHLTNPKFKTEQDTQTAPSSDLLKHDSQLRDAVNLLKGIRLANSLKSKQSG